MNFEPKQKCPRGSLYKASIVPMPKGATYLATLKSEQYECYLGWQSKPANQKKQRRLKLKDKAKVSKSMGAVAAFDAPMCDRASTSKTQRKTR